MFDAEKLLGKVLSEVTNSYSNPKKKYKKSKYRQQHRSDDLLSGLVGKLMSGKGLMTAVGLGVGAYTILKEKQSSGQQASLYQTVNVAPLPSTSSVPPPPPPLFGQPGVQSKPPVVFTADSLHEEKTRQQSLSEDQELALRMIQVMIAAAYADGNLDAEEEKEILTRLREANLDKEEKGYILSQFHSPKSIEELTAGINNPQVAHTMYSLAVSSIVVDTERERHWLDGLAQSLGMSKEMQRFIEE